MRIALIGPAHPYKGGGARHTTELAHRLTAAGHNVVIESWRAQYPARLYPGQQLLDVPEGKPYRRTYRRLAWYAPQGWLAAGRRLATADLVIFALLTPLQVPAYLAILTGLRLRPGGPRVIVICHNVLPHERRRGDVPLTQALLTRVDAILTHSPAQAAQAAELAPKVPVVTTQMPPHLPTVDDLFPERADVPPPDKALPPADKTAPRTADRAHEPCRLLFFGIVRPYKGLDVLLRALARAPEHLTLTVAGEFWGGTADTKQLIAKLGLTGRVRLRPGYLPADQLPALFAAADALVLPYREATASQNALLAFAHGVPVITTTAGALADVVRDGVDGLTCVPGDIDDLARALAAVSVPETLAELRAGITTFDAGPCWAAYLQALLAR